MTFYTNRLLIVIVMPLYSFSFSHPISFGTNFALISRVELIFLSTSRVSPHSLSLSFEKMLHYDRMKENR